MFNGAMGIYAFVDAGRVFVENDDDEKTVAGYGGGLWFSPMKKLVLTLTYAMSNEDKMPLVGLGWKF
jgi:hypothetical protein